MSNEHRELQYSGQGADRLLGSFFCMRLINTNGIPSQVLRGYSSVSTADCSESSFVQSAARTEMSRRAEEDIAGRDFAAFIACLCSNIVAKLNEQSGGGVVADNELTSPCIVLLHASI